MDFTRDKLCSLVKKWHTLIEVRVRGSPLLPTPPRLYPHRARCPSCIPARRPATEQAWVDVKTTDGYVLRLFCIAFTKKRRNQLRKTS